MLRLIAASGSRLGRLTGASAIAAGLILSGAATAQADSGSRCVGLIRDAAAFARCSVEQGEWTQAGHDAALARIAQGVTGFPGCQSVDITSDVVGWQQCRMMDLGAGFDPLPGSPQNPGVNKCSDVADVAGDYQRCLSMQDTGAMARNDAYDGSPKASKAPTKATAPVKKKAVKKPAKRTAKRGYR